jgi:hypothetical protein
MPKARGNKNKPLRSKLHIFCEGKTEHYYLKGYVEHTYPGNRLLKVIDDIVDIQDPRANTPLALVEKAINFKQECPDSDEFWVVYDRESKAGISDKIHQSAIDKAAGKNIQIAISNVCFELWLLLHFQSVSAAYTSYENLIKESKLKSSYENLLKESKLKSELKKIGIEKYDKTHPHLFDTVREKLPDARARAAQMNSETLKASTADESKPHLLNPYTRVHKLLDAIDAFVKQSMSGP